MAIIDKPSDYFNTVLYTGTSADNRAVTGVGFQPDFLWIKDRTTAFSHALFDSVRGSSKMLVTQGTEAEQTDAGSGGLTSFDTDGFTTDAGSGGNPYRNTNQSGDAYASWNWKETADAGFDIVAYTGNGSARTISHSCGAVPKMIIIKDRSAADNWNVYTAPTGNNSHMHLNLTNAASGSSSYWNTTTPTSSVFSLGSNSAVNANGNNFIAYCFAEKQGYSKIGSYVGNGNADGTFTYTNFKPAFVMVKPTVTADNWVMIDNKREGYNPDNNFVYANKTNVENDADIIDFTANGFKQTSSGGTTNRSGEPFIYMAFAENPLVTSTGVPATAR